MVKNALTKATAKPTPIIDRSPVRQQMTVLDEVVAGRGEQRRDGEKERELGRRLPRKPEQHAADDRRAGARRAGDQSERLRDAYLQRVGPAQVVDAADADVSGRVLPPLGPEDDQRAGDECRGDRHRREKAGLDRAAEGESQQRRRQEGDKRFSTKRCAAALARKPARHREQPGAVFPAHGDNRAGLDHDLEQFRPVAGVVQQRSGDDQMAG